ncbi:MAG: hypothetical protein MSH40_01315 [Christensenella sp.]|nr:hypothetical protein [Christensenella sp.]
MGLLSIFSKTGRDKNMVIDISRSHISKVLEEKNRIESNAEKIEHLMLLAEKYPDFYDQLSEIFIDVKYSNPVVNNDIKILDEQIASKLDDLTLLLSKTRIRSDLAVNHSLRDIKELIHKREMKE